jgi:Kef-type K+ transport system membrane component KefB/nucleotide-binding universal stress UspA family protein
VIGKCATGFLAAAAALATALSVSPALAAEAGGEQAIAVFIGQIVLLLLAGRLLGEAAQRLGQPAVMGQLIAGILLGPSVFGALLPELQQQVFPRNEVQQSMLAAVSQLGILLLLLVAGMETDLSLINQVRRAAVSVSVAGITVPFVCGVALGQLLPESLLPDPDRRLLTSLFLGVALSISSVKIVAVIVREMNFMRRDVGQVILAAAVIDDTIGWIIMAMIFGLALHGAVEPAALAQSVLGTLAFLAASFTLGRRAVAAIIRWSNDNFVSELPVITAIIIVMGVMALITHAIGVHTVLGAFVAGILVGQSPILTRHIDAQLRGLITAFFMPVFFGLAGLGADLSILKDPMLVALGLGLVLIASIGKFAGALVGGTIGGLSLRESLALACGMNARGSTEVIVATIGLSIGVLDRDLFSLIVAMAVITTMAMPPTLRWALARLPLKPEEAARLEREAQEARGFVPRLERLLAVTDGSASGKLAARLTGLLSSPRGTPVTVIDLASAQAGRSPPDRERDADAEQIARDAASSAAPDADGANVPADVTARRGSATPAALVAAEADKGYDLLTVGVDGAILKTGDFSEAVAQIAAPFDGPVAIVAARGPHAQDPAGYHLNILVPVNGTAYAGRAAEVALAIARASDATVTALYVAPEAAGSSSRRWPRVRTRSEADEILKGIVELGEQFGVPVRTVLRNDSSPVEAILQRARRGDHNLLIMGVTARTGDKLSFGPVVSAVGAECPRSIMLLST